MQLKTPLSALVVLAGITGAAQAQSLSPMHNSGTTPSDIKGFKLFVGNPYPTRMTFRVIPMDAQFKVAYAQELPFADALAMTADGRIADAKTIMLLQWAALSGPFRELHDSEPVGS